MHKSYKFDSELREEIKQTVTTLAKAVKSTLGPSGTNVGVLNEINLPFIVNDGVTVARKFKFNDPIKDYIANTIKTVSQNTDKTAGDGTTTSITLAEAIILNGIRQIEAGDHHIDIGKKIEVGANQVDIAKGIRLAAAQVVERLDELATEVDDNTLLQVATISANNDAELGKIISDAFIKVGVNGQIEIEDSVTGETYIDVVDGMKYDSGLTSHMFITTEGRAELEEVNILIYEGRLKNSDVSYIESALKHIQTEDESLLIIADDYDPLTLNSLTAVKMSHGLKICAVKSPGYGDNKAKILDDIALVTGAEIISSRFGKTISDFDLSDLGEAKSARVEKDSFSFIASDVDSDKVDEVVNKLKEDLKREKARGVKEEISNRIAKLTNGVAVMYVAGNSPVEVTEKKYRIEDAIHATRAALEEGIVPGGGVALLKIKSLLERPEMDNKSQETGFDIVLKALEAPIRTICQNCGVSDDKVVTEVLKGDFNYGYDARLQEYKNLIEAGVIDPVKVTKSAITNAASVSQLLLTMNCAIYE